MASICLIGNISGDISALSGMGITTIVFGATNVYGDISSFSDCEETY